LPPSRFCSAKGAVKKEGNKHSERNGPREIQKLGDSVVSSAGEKAGAKKEMKDVRPRLFPPMVDETWETIEEGSA